MEMVAREVLLRSLMMSGRGRLSWSRPFMCSGRRRMVSMFLRPGRETSGTADFAVGVAAPEEGVAARGVPLAGLWPFVLSERTFHLGAVFAAGWGLGPPRSGNSSRDWVSRVLAAGAVSFCLPAAFADSAGESVAAAAASWGFRSSSGTSSIVTW